MHPSATETLDNLKRRFPEAPFLALGQTALWDEPTKATLRRALDRLWPEARLIAATHDTDYFAKLPAHPTASEHGSYALLLHDDARTRGLWSAAGEMSQLFGSEDVVTREMLQQEAGVTLHRALAPSDDPEFLLSELTTAWGWTGIVYTEWDRKVVQDIGLVDILPTLLEQVEGAIQASADCLNGPRAAAARTLTEKVKNWMTAFARVQPHASLADLYQYLLPHFYELLLDTPPRHLSTSRTTELLRFNSGTAALPRFAFAELFMNPQTRAQAEVAYNLAVSGSDIYTLDRFGEGALPFDIVIKGVGRGTLHLPGQGRVVIDTPGEGIYLRDPERDITSVGRLAELLESKLGPEVALVGKAITLLPMLTAEHILVFHEGASSYSSRTREVVMEMKRRGLPVAPLHPILRLKYATWEAIGAVPAEGEEDDLSLPPHLEQGFCRPRVSFHDFACCWGYAQNRERHRLTELAELRSPRRLLEHFARTRQNGWEEKRAAYEKATLTLLEIREQSDTFLGEILTLQDEVRRLKGEAVALEQAKGDDFRARIQPLRDRLLDSHPDSAEIEARIAALQEEREATFDQPIAAHRNRVRELLQVIRELKQRRRSVERGEKATAARAILREIEGEAETEKARLCGNALRVIHGLTHTNYRPSSWWFPLVDPSGAWFHCLTATTEYHLEPLDE